MWSGGGFCCHDSEPFGSVKCGEVSRATKWYQYLKYDSTSQNLFPSPDIEVRFPVSVICAQANYLYAAEERILSSVSYREDHQISLR